MGDLTDFLLARVADDEEMARKASQGKWKLWGMSVMADRAGTSNVDTAVPVAQTYSEGDRPRTWNATHIACHDPARVLAECAAKRAILTAYEEQPEDGTIAAVRALAAVHADHPDYREEDWKP